MKTYAAQGSSGTVPLCESCSILESYKHGYILWKKILIHQNAILR